MEIFLQKQKESFELPYLHTNYFATLLKKYKMKKKASQFFNSDLMFIFL
jgi:hypothetical protein